MNRFNYELNETGQSYHHNHFTVLYCFTQVDVGHSWSLRQNMGLRRLRTVSYCVEFYSFSFVFILLPQEKAPAVLNPLRRFH